MDETVVDEAVDVGEGVAVDRTVDVMAEASRLTAPLATVCSAFTARASR